MSAPVNRSWIGLVVGLCVGALAVAATPHSWLFRDAPNQVDASLGDGRKYACPMFCTMKDAPGTCPVCGMDMEPVVDEGRQVRLGHRERFMAGVRTAVVVRTEGVHRLRALGHIRRDERLESQVTAGVGGRLERLFVDFTGDTVVKGQRVASIYAPELVAAQEELLSAKHALDEIDKASDSLLEGAASIYKASKRRLELLGVPESFIAAVERDGKARDHVDLVAHVAGTVFGKSVSVGDYVKTGSNLFSVVDLSTVWAMLDVFEEDAGAVFVGQRVEVAVPSLPGEVFRGTISFVDPLLDTKRRVVRVRVDLPNPTGRLKPGAYVDASVLVSLSRGGQVLDPKAKQPPGHVLTVPRSAVLDGGDRKIVYVMTQEAGPLENGENRWPAIYEPREIKTGFRIRDSLVVLDGLEEDEEVVTRGQFLIDSQLQLTGKPSFMLPEAAAAPADPHAGHGG